MHGKTRNLAKSKLLRRDLNALVLGARTTIDGREFQIFIMRQEKKFLRVLCLARGTRSRKG